MKKVHATASVISGHPLSECGERVPIKRTTQTRSEITCGRCLRILGARDEREARRALVVEVKTIR